MRKKMKNKGKIKKNSYIGGEDAPSSCSVKEECKVVCG